MLDKITVDEVMVFQFFISKVQLVQKYPIINEEEMMFQFLIGKVPRATAIVLFIMERP